jgi:hypothetical protein
VAERLVLVMAQLRTAPQELGEIYELMYEFIHGGGRLPLTPGGSKGPVCEAGGVTGQEAVTAWMCREDWFKVRNTSGTSSGRSGAADPVSLDPAYREAVRVAVAAAVEAWDGGIK